MMSWSLNKMGEKLQMTFSNIFEVHHLSSLNVIFKELREDLDKNQWTMNQKQ